MVGCPASPAPRTSQLKIFLSKNIRPRFARNSRPRSWRGGLSRLSAVFVYSGSSKNIRGRFAGDSRPIFSGGYFEEILSRGNCSGIFRNCPIYVCVRAATGLFPTLEIFILRNATSEFARYTLTCSDIRDSTTLIGQSITYTGSSSARFLLLLSTAVQSQSLLAASCKSRSRFPGIADRPLRRNRR